MEGTIVAKGNARTMAFLREKKAKDGKLNRLGEWILSGGNLGGYYTTDDLRCILR